MKNKLLVLIFTLSLGAFAQKPMDNPKYGSTPEIRKVCLTNLSIYAEYVKQKNYADAVDAWRIALDTCPKASKNLYIHGAKIEKYLIKQEKDLDKKKAIVERLLKLYDKRIENFGKEGYVLGKKGSDAFNLKKDNRKIAYDALKKSMQLEKGKSTSSVILYFMLASSDLFKKNVIKKEDVIADYQLANITIEEALKVAKKPSIVSSLKSKKTKIEKLFVASGAANCNDLQVAFEPKIKASQDVALYRSVMKTLEGAGCNYEPFYQDLVIKTYELEPSAAEAEALAKKYYADSDYAGATKFYNEAIKLQADDIKKSEYHEKIARMQVKDEKLDEARTSLNEAIKYNPKNAKAYILLGDIYAKQTKTYKDAFEKSTVFWAVVDKYRKAKSVDPSVAKDVKAKIANYSKYFPKIDDIFFRNLQVGSSYKVKGWVNETTTVRQSK